MEKQCESCGRPMIPAPARFDGEDTFVGFMPCACSWTAFLDNRFDGESFDDYKSRIGNPAANERTM